MTENLQRNSDDESIHDYCRKFSESAGLRELVLGISRFDVDLCAALKLPVDVTTTSLLFLQQFLNNFDVFSLDRQLICGACILLGWKYWEDHDEIRSVRKLNEICRQIFKLLMFPVDDSESEENEESEAESENEKGCYESINSCPEKQEKYCKDNHDSDQIVKGNPNWRNTLEPLSASTWTLRDGGKEFNQMKDRIKLFESALLRCVDFEVGPTLLPFDEVQSLSQMVWINALPANRHIETQPLFRTKRPSCYQSLKSSTSEFASSSSPRLSLELSSADVNPSATSSDASLTVNSAGGRSDLPQQTSLTDQRYYSRAKRQRPLPSPECATPKNLRLATDLKQHSVINSIPETGESNKQESEISDHHRTSQPPSPTFHFLRPHMQQRGDIVSSQSSSKLSEANLRMERLDELLHLSRGFVVDYYRSPFCLLSNPISIAIVAVWKASIILGIYHSSLEIMIRNLVSSSSKRKSSPDNHTKDEPIISTSSNKFSLFIYHRHNIDQCIHVLHRFRQLYQWMVELEIQRHNGIQQLHFERKMIRRKRKRIGQLILMKTILKEDNLQ